MIATIPIHERELQRQSFIATELKIARYLGRMSFRGVWRAIMRNHYPAGPFHDEWADGRESEQYGRVEPKAEDAPFKRPHFYDTDKRTA